MQNDKGKLIDQLKIDRTGPAAGPPQRGMGLWIAGGVAAVLAIGLGGWLVFSGPSGVPIKAATARAVAGEGAAAGGSILDATGYVVARTNATVTAKISGRVLEVLVEEGQLIEKDQIVARLDDLSQRNTLAQVTAQVRQVEANLATARANFENAKPRLERQKLLLKDNATSQEAYEAAKTSYDAARTGLAASEAALEVSRASLKTAEQNLADTVVRASFGGIVVARNAQPGETVSSTATGGGAGARTGICTVVDMNSLEVQVDVSENFIARIKAGQPATIRLNAYPDWQIPGEIIIVIPKADKAKATVMVRVAIKEKDARVLPDMGARVSFLDNTPRPVGDTKPRAVGVIVPTDSVQGTGDNGTVFVISKDTVQKRTVRLGARGPDGQTILSGLNAGEQVATGDLSQLNDGVKVVVQ